MMGPPSHAGFLLISSKKSSYQAGWAASNWSEIQTLASGWCFKSTGTSFSSQANRTSGDMLPGSPPGMNRWSSLFISPKRRSLSSSLC